MALERDCYKGCLYFRKIQEATMEDLEHCLECFNSDFKSPERKEDENVSFINAHE